MKEIREQSPDLFESPVKPSSPIVSPDLFETDHSKTQSTSSSSTLQSSYNSLWDKYQDPNKGDYNILKSSQSISQESQSSQSKFQPLLDENEKLKTQVQTLTEENEKLKLKLHAYKTDFDNTLIKENSILKEKIEELEFQLNLYKVSTPKK